MDFNRWIFSILLPVRILQRTNPWQDVYKINCCITNRESKQFFYSDLRTNSHEIYSNRHFIVFILGEWSSRLDFKNGYSQTIAIKIIFNAFHMKKKFYNVLAMVVIAATLSSCATVFGGQVSACQKTKPTAGQPARSVRGVALVADILLFWPGAVVDFATGAIYRPCGK